MLGTNYEILSDRGALKRVTIEHGLTDVKPALAVQARLMQILPSLKPKPEHDLHVTLYHLGQPDEIYKAMAGFNPHLDYKVFLHRFLQLLIDNEHVVAAPQVLPVKCLGKFGNPAEPTLALELVPNATVGHAFEAVARNFHAFLAAGGVPDIDTFLASTSIGYRSDQPFMPHVSLGRLPQDAPLPAIDTAGLNIKLTRSRLRNVMIRRGNTLEYSS